MNNHAAVLRELAELIDDGMPSPINVTLSRHNYRTCVQVHVTDIGYWLSRMDLPEPDWYGNAGEPLHARWPEGSFDGHPYVLACVSTANVSVSA